MDSVAHGGILQVPIGQLAHYIAETNYSLDAVQKHGNTYKNLLEVGSMRRGLTVVVLINLFVATLGCFFFRYVILKEAGPLTPAEIELLEKYPAEYIDYTPTVSFVRAPPPYRWKGWADYFTGPEDNLSSDGQVYLSFLRACLCTTFVCGAFSSILLPFYWCGGNLAKVANDSSDNKGRKSILTMLESDRGVFERFTSHNLQPNSPFLLLQLPVMVVIAFCVIFAYTVVKTRAIETEDCPDDWPNEVYDEEVEDSHSPHSSNGTSLYRASHIEPSPYSTYATQINRRTRGREAPHKEWTILAQGLPRDLKSGNELAEMLNAIFPSQVDQVQIVCNGRMSEARLNRELMSAQYRRDYLQKYMDDDMVNQHFSSKTTFGRMISLFVRRRTREQLLDEHNDRINFLKREIISMRAEPMRGFRGFAFITFKSSKAAEIALKYGARYHGGIFESPDSSYGSLPSIEEEQHLTPQPVFVREELEFRFPSLSNLYRGIVDIMPASVRDWIKSNPYLEPSSPPNVDIYHSLLVGPESIYYSPQRYRQIVLYRLRNMKAERAPKSADIIWENIGISFTGRIIREVLIQFVVFTVLILFTSPIAMVTAGKLLISELEVLADPNLQNMTGTPVPSGNPLLPRINVTDHNAVVSITDAIVKHFPDALKHNELLKTALFNYVPVLLLSVVFSLVPSLLRLTCKWEGYGTQSMRELSVLRKTTLYYVMNSVLLPSLALNTVAEMLDTLYEESNGGEDIGSAFPILKSLFKGDIAFFLCCCVVQLSFTGSVLLLLRLPASFSIMIRRRLALTPLDTAEAKCTDLFDFPRNYSYCVTVMCMCLLFGCMAPVTWWFSFIYFFTKYAVDNYKIRYVHPRSYNDGRLPKASISFLLVWTVVGQVAIAVVFYLQNWYKASCLCVLICIITLAACLSVGPGVGKGAMKFIAYARDALMRQVIGDGTNLFGWAIGPAYSCGDGTNVLAYSIGPAYSGAIPTLVSRSPGLTPTTIHSNSFRVAGLGGPDSSPDVSAGWMRPMNLLSPLMESSVLDENLLSRLVAQSSAAGYNSDDLNEKRSGRTSVDTRIEDTESFDRPHSEHSYELDLFLDGPTRSRESSSDGSESGG